MRLGQYIFSTCSKTAIAVDQRAQLAQQIDRARDMVLAHFAQVTISFMGVPRYAHQSIKDLQALAMIPLMRERVAIATVAPANDENATAGAGSLTNPLLGIAPKNNKGANVSEEVDAKIREQAPKAFWAGIFPVKLNPEDWTSGDIVWLLDVIAQKTKMAQKFSAQVLAAFKQVLAEKLPDRKSNDVKLHPIIKKMIGEEVLMQMGARESNRSSESIAPKGPKRGAARGKSSGKTKPEVKTTIGKPKKKTTPGAKSKKKVN